MPPDERPGPPSAAPRARKQTPPQVQDLRNAVRRVLGLDDDTAVVIRRLGPAGPGRPTATTIISVQAMNGDTRRWAVPQPAETITENILGAALRRVPPARGTTRPWQT